MTGVAFGPLAGIDLELGPGETGWLQGRSGAGKTLILYLAAGLVAPERGSVLLDGSAPSPDQAAMLFQNPDYQLLASSVWEDIRFNAPTDEEASRAAEATDCRELLEKPLEGLSPGQRRRVSLAGALAARRPLLLLDTPFAGMGQREARALWEGIYQSLEGSRTSVLATGDPPGDGPAGLCWEVSRWRRSGPAGSASGPTGGG